MAACLLAGCTPGGWTPEERELIENQPAVMRVLTIDNPADAAVLREKSRDLPAGALVEPLYAELAAKMVATVISPEQDGVGIAGPQVGVLRRIVAVQRFDKEGEPFEVYPNIRIVAVRGEKEAGREGCLSVPDCRGTVLRYRDIDIRYTDPATGRDTTENVTGFTAVIFQHETDHLDGILYTDRTEISYRVALSEFLYDTASFPSCHAATVAATPEGGLVAAFFGGSREGGNDVCIWMCRKDREDAAWSEPEVVATGAVGEAVQHPCWNPVLYQVPEGDLLLFYKTGVYIKDWVGHLMRSSDGGRTWSDPEPLGRYNGEADGAAFLGAIKNKPVDVEGRIVAPSSDESVRWRIHFEISEDQGRHWHYVSVPSADTILSIQPAILVHRDGTLQALCRTKNGFLSTTYSQDGGLSWEPERLTDIPNNNSGIDCATLSNGLFAMVYNPAGKERGQEFGPRTPLVLAFSRDGLHWSPALTLEEGEGEFSYPSIVEADGALHIVYTWNRRKIKYVRVQTDLDNKR